MAFNLFPLLGIDIGTSSVKVVELAGSGKKRKLQALGLEILPPEAIVDGAVNDPDAVERAVVELLDKLHIDTRGRRAAFAVNGGAVHLKRVLVDANAPELEDTINHEAEQYFQTDMNDLYFQYQKLSGWSEDPARSPFILVGAARENVDQYLSVLRNVGLRTGVVDCDVLCAANMFEFNNDTAAVPVALLEIGAEFTRFTVVWHGQVMMSRVLSLGGKLFTKKLMATLGVDYMSAESFKIAMSVDQSSVPQEAFKAVQEQSEAFCTEVQKLVQIFHETHGPQLQNQKLAHVFMFGGASRTLGLDALMAGALQIPVQILNPLSRIKINPNRFQMDYLLMQGHVFSVAVGLALRKFGDSAA